MCFPVAACWCVLRLTYRCYRDDSYICIWTSVKAVHLERVLITLYYWHRPGKDSVSLLECCWQNYPKANDFDEIFTALNRDTEWLECSKTVKCLKDYIHISPWSGPNLIFLLPSDSDYYFFTEVLTNQMRFGSYCMGNEPLLCGSKSYLISDSVSAVRTVRSEFMCHQW